MAAADAGNIAVFRRRRQVQVADDLVAETAINVPLLGDDIVINLHRLGDDPGVLQGYLPFPRYVDIQYAREFATDKDLFHQGLHQTRRFPAAVFVHLSHGHGQGRHLIIWSFHGRRNGTGIEDIAAEIKAIVDTGNDEVRPVIAEKVFHSHFDTVHRRAGHGNFPYLFPDSAMFVAIKGTVDGHGMGSSTALPRRGHDGDFSGIVHQFFFQDLQAPCLQAVIIGK